jgi:hypothetical protein
LGLDDPAVPDLATVTLVDETPRFRLEAPQVGDLPFHIGHLLAVRARAIIVNGLSLGAFGVFVAGNSLHNALVVRVPRAEIMGLVGILALLANVGVAALLYAQRQGDAIMQSVWICSRNDAIGDVAVVTAALGVFGTGTGWPDIAVALVMAYLSVTGAIVIVRSAMGELRGTGRDVHGSTGGIVGTRAPGEGNWAARDR